jgi:hypothetical protein
MEMRVGNKPAQLAARDGRTIVSRPIRQLIDLGQNVL